MNNKGVNTRFSKTSQPSPAAKKKGWEKWRAQRNLTQAVIREMKQGDNLKEYALKLIALAKKGNPKAIEAINSRLEDDPAQRLTIDFEQMDDAAIDELFNRLISKQ